MLRVGSQQLQNSMALQRLNGCSPGQEQVTKVTPICQHPA